MSIPQDVRDIDFNEIKNFLFSKVLVVSQIDALEIIPSFNDGRLRYHYFYRHDNNEVPPKVGDRGFILETKMSLDRDKILHKKSLFRLIYEYFSYDAARMLQGNKWIPQYYLAPLNIRDDLDHTAMYYQFFDNLYVYGKYVRGSDGISYADGIFTMIKYHEGSLDIKLFELKYELGVLRQVTIYLAQEEIYHYYNRINFDNYGFITQIIGRNSIIDLSLITEKPSYQKVYNQNGTLREYRPVDIHQTDSDNGSLHQFTLAENGIFLNDYRIGYILQSKIVNDKTFYDTIKRYIDELNEYKNILRSELTVIQDRNVINIIIEYGRETQYDSVFETLRHTFEVFLSEGKKDNNQLLINEAQKISNVLMNL